MKPILTFSLLVLTISFSYTQTNNRSAQQKEIISKLSGHSPITKNTLLKDRHSNRARKVSAEYLKYKISFFCDKSEIINYKKRARNVTGSIMATSKTNQWIIIGAHFDSVKNSPGANDNATGVALVYAVAEYISTLEVRKYNLQIVFFDQEERRFKGSKAYAKQLLENKVNVVSVHTIDQLGWDEDGDRGIELEVPTDQIRDQYSKVAGEYNYTFPIQISDVTSTDHRSFRQLGFAATGITEEYKNGDTTPHYHRSTDTYETVNFAYLTTITEYVQKVFEDMMK
ncbi:MULTISPECIES: M28 family metallopeptidase [Roseivirga]|nr:MULTISPECIES: M28 family peptidase [Roseivirga]WPZ09281.1 M28 family peptidase [Roseivirga spongicola]